LVGFYLAEKNLLGVFKKNGSIPHSLKILIKISIFPAPPSPLTITHDQMVLANDQIGLHTLSRNMPRPGSQSPPLPPPPEEEHAEFGRPRQQSLVAPIVPEDQNLPGWVPKNYIEKGTDFT
jgi:hypothetical protein